MDKELANKRRRCKRALQQYYAIKPYDKPNNQVYGDWYYYQSIVEKFGAEFVEEVDKELRPKESK